MLVVIDPLSLPRLLRVGIAAAAVAGGLAGAWIYTKRQPRATAEPGNAHISAAVCTGCHPGIAATYRKTGMRRSFARANAENVPAFGKTFHHQASGSDFSMITRDGKSYQRRWQIGFDGKENNTDEKQVDFVVGSGNYSRTYLHLTSQNTLRVLALSWYADKDGYRDMSPGYDQPDYPGSIRPVHYECMFCHNAYPKIPDAFEHAGSTEMTFAQPFPEGGRLPEMPRVPTPMSAPKPWTYFTSWDSRNAGPPPHPARSPFKT